MELSQEGINFIKGFEGCVLHPYLDQGGTPTIGWGMTYYPGTFTKVKMTDSSLTQAQADSFFLLIVKPFSTGVVEACRGSLNDNQLTALTDFAYNCGLGAFKQSTLLQHVNQNCVVESDFTLYDHIGQEVSVGLLNRRKAEYQLFIKPINIMDKTLITPETPITIQINSISVNVDLIQNGQTVQSGATESVSVTPELIAAFQKSNLVAEGATNVTVA